MLTAHLHKIKTPDYLAHNPCYPRSGRKKLFILTIKSTRCTNSQIYFLNKTLHFSDRFSVHHQESSTVHTAINICHTSFAVCTVLDSL